MPSTPAALDSPLTSADASGSRVQGVGFSGVQGLGRILCVEKIQNPRLKMALKRFRAQII